jgi:hypothetical protein
MHAKARLEVWSSEVGEILMKIPPAVQSYFSHFAGLSIPV